MVLLTYFYETGAMQKQFLYFTLKVNKNVQIEDWAILNSLGTVTEL